jgi:hypothetical protein
MGGSKAGGGSGRLAHAAKISAGRIGANPVSFNILRSAALGTFICLSPIEGLGEKLEDQEKPHREFCTSAGGFATMGRKSTLPRGAASQSRAAEHDGASLSRTRRIAMIRATRAARAAVR